MHDDEASSRYDWLLGLLLVCLFGLAFGGCRFEYQLKIEHRKTSTQRSERSHP